MSKLRVAFIGTGPNPDKPGAMGYAMAYRHADAYLTIPDIEFVAAADIKPENGQAFCAKYAVPELFTDYSEMLAAVKPDLVSICTWPHLHRMMVEDCARAGVPAIHSEKPVAYNWGDCVAMVEACEKSGSKLTFNHQRRYGLPFSQAKQLLDEGRIGQLQTIEYAIGDLYDYGSHNFDMINYFNNETDPVWVLGAIDYSQEKLIFGTHNENHALAIWQYENGVFGMALTGDPKGAVNCHHRIMGTDGMIEIGREGKEPLRVLSAGKDWEVIDCAGESVHGPGFIERCLADVVDAIRTGRESMMCARNALRASQIIFGVYESVRRRGMVRFPLEFTDHPLVDMVEKGELKPAKAE